MLLIEKSTFFPLLCIKHMFDDRQKIIFQFTRNIVYIPRITNGRCVNSLCGRRKAICFNIPHKTINILSNYCHQHHKEAYGNPITF